MSRALVTLSPGTLEAVADALEGGRVQAVTPLALGGLVPEADIRTVTQELAGLVKSAGGVRMTAVVLRAMAAERAYAERVADQRIQLVWTGPESHAAGTRDTSVVVRDLLRSARTFALVSGYSVFGGRELFKPLCDAMIESPSVCARICLNIQRRDGDDRPPDSVVAEFAERFKRHEWPEARLPELYYDPRALDLDRARRAVLHAKCVVVDDTLALITSANPTEAAQARNIEAGVLITDSIFAASLRRQFDGLIERGELRRVAL